MTSGNTRERVLVIGLDGAVPAIIHKLVGQGRMPNMAKVLQESSSGILKSTIPSISSLAWASFATGNHPGKHGIFGFQGKEKSSYQTRIMYASDVHGKTLWQMLGDAGRRVVVMNVIMTYPPVPVNGTLVSGIIAPMEALHRGFTYPPELADELIKEGYKVEPDTLIYQSRDKYIDEVFSMTEKRASTALRFLDEQDWDFFMVLFTSTDRLQHRFWQMMEPEHFDVSPDDVEKYGDVIYKAYEQLDGIIGRFMERIDDDVTVIFMSDHSFGHAHTNLNLHNWLVEEGLLNLNLSFRKRMFLARYRDLTKWLGRLKLMGLVSATRRYLPGGFRKVSGSLNISGNIEWSTTKVWSIEKALYINLKGRDPQGIVEPGQEYDELRESLTQKLLAIEDPATGKPIVERVFKGEEVYWGPHSELGGDLVVRFNKGYRHWPRLAPGAPVITRENIFCSYHHDHEDGFVAVVGPDIKKGETIEASIVDLTPTILHLLSAPGPSDLDGQVLRSIMQEGSDVATRSALFTEPEDGRSKIRQRIREMRDKGRI